MPRKHRKADTARATLPMATPVAAMNLAPELRILPNLAIHNINFPHDTAKGTWIQVKAVTTKVRVGLAGTLPAAPKHVTMSFHTASGEITALAVQNAGYSIYGGASTSLELRNVVVLPEAESDGGVARGACVAEATFVFKFGVTAAQIPGLTKDIPVWLRFTVNGSPDLYVDSPPFRLVARNCTDRNPKAKKRVLATQKMITQVLSRDRGAIVLALARARTARRTSTPTPTLTLTLTLSRCPPTSSS